MLGRGLSLLGGGGGEFVGGLEIFGGGGVKLCKKCVH